MDDLERIKKIYAKAIKKLARPSCARSLSDFRRRLYTSNEGGESLCICVQELSRLLAIASREIESLRQLKTKDTNQEVQRIVTSLVAELAPVCTGFSMSALLYYRNLDPSSKEQIDQDLEPHWVDAADCLAILQGELKTVLGSPNSRMFLTSQPNDDLEPLKQQIETLLRLSISDLKRNLDYGISPFSHMAEFIPKSE